MNSKIKDLITATISGEWGEEATDGVGVKVIRTANFTNLGVIDYKNIVKRKIESKKINQKRLLKGDIIIEKSGGSPNQPVGRVVFFGTDQYEDFLCNNFTAILRPDKTKVYPKYLFYQLFIGHIRGKTLKYQNKTTGILNLKLDKYLNETIYLPSLPDQIKIAHVLSNVEALIIQRKESIVLLDDFLKSTFLKMFGDVTVGENLERLEEGLTLVGGGAFKSSDFVEKGIPVIKIGTVNKGYFDLKSLSFLPQDFLLSSKRYVVKPGELLLSLTGTVGKDDYGNTCFATDVYKEYFLNQRVAKVVTKKNKLNSCFVNFLFKYPSFKANLLKSNRGVRQANLSNADIYNSKIRFPKIELQNEFTYIVEKAETLKSYFQVSLKELENLLSSLSQKAFKGELDLSSFDVFSEEEEYASYTNDRTEDFHFPEPKYKVEKKKKKNEEQKKETLTKIQKELSSKTKLNWESVSTQQMANWIIDKYTDFHFNSEMLIRFLMNEHIISPYYFSSEELKKNPLTNEADDLKSFIFSAIEGENPFINLEQVFYNAEEETIQLKVTPEDYKLLKNKSKEERSGIYFNIIK